MRVLLGAALLALLPSPVVLKRTAKVDEKAEYEMKALIDLGGKDDVKFSGTFKERTKAIDAGKVTTAVDSRVSVDVLGVVRTSGLLQSERVETTDGALVTAAKTDPTLLFARPRIDRLRAFIFPAKPVEVGESWWQLSGKDDSMKAPPSSSYFKLEGEEKVGDRDTWRASMDAHEVDVESSTHVKGMVWLDKTDGSLVRGQWAIDGFSPDTQTPPMKVRLEYSRTN